MDGAGVHCLTAAGIKACKPFFLEVNQTAKAVRVADHGPGAHIWRSSVSPQQEVEARDTWAVVFAPVSAQYELLQQSI